jgi:hypothetical protein
MDPNDHRDRDRVVVLHGRQLVLMIQGIGLVEPGLIPGFFYAKNIFKKKYQN